VRWTLAFLILSVFSLSYLSGGFEEHRKTLYSEESGLASRTLDMKVAVPDHSHSPQMDARQAFFQPHDSEINTNGLWQLNGVEGEGYRITKAQSFLDQLTDQKLLTLHLPERAKPIQTTLNSRKPHETFSGIEILKGKVISDSPFEHVLVAKGKEETLVTFQLTSGTWLAKINNVSASGILRPDSLYLDHYKIH